MNALNRWPYQLILLGATSVIVALMNFLCNAHRPDWNAPEPITMERLIPIKESTVYADVVDQHITIWRDGGSCRDVNLSNWDVIVSAVMENWRKGMVLVIRVGRENCGTGVRVAKRLHKDIGTPVYFMCLNTAKVPRP